MKSRKTNSRTQLVVQGLYDKSRETKAKFWKDLARRLEKPSKSWAKINLGKLDRITKSKETIVVPGKILGFGALMHPLNIYAFNATSSALKDIQRSGGSFGTLEDLLSKNPKPKDLRIVK